MLKFRDAGNVLRIGRSFKFRDAGNVLRTARRVRVRDAGNVLREMYTAVSITLADATYSRGGPSVPVSSSFTVANDGLLRRGDGGLALGTWCSDALFVGNFEVRAVHVGGVVPTGTLDAWLSCATSRTWSVTDTAADDSPVDGIIQVSIREASTGTVHATANITIRANVTGGTGGGGGEL